MTELNTQVLAFAAVQEVVVGDQVTVRLRTCLPYSGSSRLGSPRSAATSQRIGHDPLAPCDRVGWLWVAAVRDRFGACERILTAREMQTLDRAAPDARPPRFGAGVGGDDGAARRRHYPDLLFIADWGRDRFALAA